MNIFKKKEINIALLEQEIKKLNARLELAKQDRRVANYVNLSYYRTNELYITMIEDRLVALLKHVPQNYINQNK